jgi:hypothetical protein
MKNREIIMRRLERAEGEVEKITFLFESWWFKRTSRRSINYTS